MMIERNCVIGCGILLFSAFGAAAMPAASQDAEMGASFVEEFDRLDAGRWYTSDGWTNGPHQNCTWRAGNVRIEDGVLQLKLQAQADPAAGGAPAPEHRPYSCAEIQTQEVFGYGTYEVRMRPAAARGLVSAFFSYIGPRPDAPAPHDEIDFEFLGKDRRAVQLNYFAEGQGGHEFMAPLAFDSSETMADYAFEWLPDSIRWFVNGALVHELKPEEGKPFPRTPSKIMLSIWGGEGLEGWLGAFEYPGAPLIARYERVAFTRAGEKCQFAASIVCQRQGKSAQN